MRGTSGEQGQATVEWVALLLVAALVLGALAAFRSPLEGRGMGETVAERITCAARGACGRASEAPRRGRSPVTAPRGRPRSHVSADAFQRLRGTGWIARRAWIVCLGYRRWRYEYQHPRAPTEPLPLDEALDIVDTCLNPFSFLGMD
jgi:hypothetical protein